MGPVSEADGHDAPRLVGDLVPGLATVVDDVVIVLEDPVGEVVVAHELPEVFNGVELRRFGRQRQERQVRRSLKRLGEVPAGLIKQHDGVVAGLDLGADLLQVLAHRLAVAVGHHQAGGGSLVGADRTEDVGPLGALVLGRGRTGSAPGPAAGDLVLLPDARFILPPDLELGPLWELVPDLLDPEGENLS